VVLKSTIPIHKKLLLMCAILIIECTFSFLAGQLPATIKYKLDLRIDYNNERLYGRCELTLTNRSDKPVNKIPIMLYRLLSVKNITDEKGDPCIYTQKVTNIEGWDQLQANFIEVSLEKDVLPGEIKTIIIDYEGYLLGYVNEGWRYVKDHISGEFTIIRTDGFDYPVVGYPNTQEMLAVGKELYDYQIAVSVPSDIVAACGGKLVNVTRNGDETTYIFKSKKPSWRLDIALDDYRLFEKDGNIIYYFKNDSLAAKSMLNTLKSTLDLYTEWFGFIDNDQGYSIIELPEGYSSQADVLSFNITSDNFSKPEGKLTVYHEISHLWNAKALELQPCRFESEGLAEFLKCLASEKLEGNTNIVYETAVRNLADIRESFSENTEYQNVPIKDYGIKDMTQYSYTFGMVVFAIFYDLCGEKNFNKIIRSYYAAYHEKGATLEDFIGCCKKSVPFNMDSFFDDWIYSTSAVKRVVSGETYQDFTDYYKNKLKKP
jgi:hypothetical protein